MTCLRFNTSGNSDNSGAPVIRLAPSGFRLKGRGQMHRTTPNTVLTGTRCQKLCAVNGNERFTRIGFTQAQRRCTGKLKRREDRRLSVNAEPADSGGAISDVGEGEAASNEAAPLQAPREDDVSCASSNGTPFVYHRQSIARRGKRTAPKEIKRAFKVSRNPHSMLWSCPPEDGGCLVERVFPDALGSATIMCSEGGGCLLEIYGPIYGQGLKRYCMSG